MGLFILQMIVFTLDNLKIIFLMVLENFYGLMENIIVVIIKMELKMVLVFLFGILIIMMLILDFGMIEKVMVLELN